VAACGPHIPGFTSVFINRFNVLNQENSVLFAGPTELLCLMWSHPVLQILKWFEITLQDFRTAISLKKTSIPGSQQRLSWLNYYQIFVETTISLPLSSKHFSSTCPERCEFRKLFHMQNLSKKGTRHFSNLLLVSEIIFLAQINGINVRPHIEKLNNATVLEN